jgi:hypothetical protein
MKMRGLMLYGILFVVTLLLLAMIWHWQMAGAYFVCHHRGIILDFLPPFAHGNDGDFYVKPERVVYAIWAVYLALALALPALLTWMSVRLYLKELDLSWR